VDRALFTRTSKIGTLQTLATQPLPHPKSSAQHRPAKRRPCDFVLFVDNDIIFQAGWLEKLVGCARETGASIVTPLICIGEPAFETIHFYSGGARIGSTPEGNRLYIENPTAGRRRAEVNATLRREYCSMIESHCMLVRMDLLRELGEFDEGLLSANDHVDLSLRARAAGATLCVEPAAVVHQLLPTPLPHGWSDVPFFMLRWSDAWNRASLEHFRAKWNLGAEDPTLAADYAWLSGRWRHIFRPLVPPSVRRLRRLLRRLRALALSRRAR